MSPLRSSSTYTSINSRLPKRACIAHQWEAFTVVRRKEPTVSFLVGDMKTTWTMATPSIIRDPVGEI